MITFEKQAAQGDVHFVRIDNLPEGLTLKEVTTLENGKYVVAHSETGHHHHVDARDAKFYEVEGEPFTAFLVVTKATPITHARSFDTHKPIMFQPGAYKINRQREATPEGFRRAAD